MRCLIFFNKFSDIRFRLVLDAREAVLNYKKLISDLLTAFGAQGGLLHLQCSYDPACS